MRVTIERPKPVEPSPPVGLAEIRIQLRSTVYHCRSVIVSISTMPTPTGQMTVTLTRELERYVREKVHEGTFATPSEYIRDLVRTRYLAEKDQAAKLRALDAALAEGLADTASGRTVELREAFARIRAEIGLIEEDKAG